MRDTLYRERQLWSGNESVEIRYVSDSYVAGTSALSPGVPRHMYLWIHRDIGVLLEELEEGGLARAHVALDGDGKGAPRPPGKDSSDIIDLFRQQKVSFKLQLCEVSDLNQETCNYT